MTPEVLPIDALCEQDKRAMLALLSRCFVGVRTEVFYADLTDKTLAVLLRDEGGVLMGFTTLALYPTVGPDGDDATIVCSGDTIVAPEAWGSSALPRVWVNAALDWHGDQGVGRLYWLLLTSGFRTYRFLPVFVQAFYPHANQPTPPAMHAWMQRVSAERWGDAYDPAAGVVRFEHPQRLRGGLVEVPAAKREDPHVRHFLKLNPGAADGDELVSVCELGAANLTRAGLRMLRAGAGQGAAHGEMH